MVSGGGGVLLPMGGGGGPESLVAGMSSSIKKTRDLGLELGLRIGWQLGIRDIPSFGGIQCKIYLFWFGLKASLFRAFHPTRQRYAFSQGSCMPLCLFLQAHPPQARVTPRHPPKPIRVKVRVRAPWHISLSSVLDLP